MILSSDELEILGYLKAWKGKFISLIAICRNAGGRRRFKDSPNWANPLMERLVEMKLVEVDEGGRYRAPDDDQKAAIVGDDYFPAADEFSLDETDDLSKP